MLSHKKFLEKFKETISRKHNDVIEKDLKLEEMNEWISNKQIVDIKSPGWSDRPQSYYDRIRKTHDEVQAIIDILSDPLILRHRGLR